MNWETSENPFNVLPSWEEVAKDVREKNEVFSIYSKTLYEKWCSIANQLLALQSDQEELSFKGQIESALITDIKEELIPAIPLVGSHIIKAYLQYPDLSSIEAAALVRSKAKQVNSQLAMLSQVAAQLKDYCKSIQEELESFKETYKLWVQHLKQTEMNDDWELF